VNMQFLYQFIYICTIIPTICLLTMIVYANIVSKSTKKESQTSVASTSESSPSPEEKEEEEEEEEEGKEDTEDLVNGPDLEEPYSTVMKDLIKDAEELRNKSDDVFERVELSKKVKEGSPDLTIHKVKSNSGVKLIVKRVFDVSPSFLTKVLWDPEVVKALNPDSKITGVLEELKSGIRGKDRIVHIKTLPKGPVSSRHMVLFRHREILQNGTIIIAQTDLKSHDKDPDKSNRKAYRMRQSSVMFLCPFGQNGEKTEMIDVYFVDLNLSSFVQSTVYSYVAKAATPKRLYKLNKAISNAKTHGIRLPSRRRRRRRRTSPSSSGTISTSSSNSTVSDTISEQNNDDDDKSSFHETLKQAQPYLVALIAVATVIRCVRRGRFR